MISVNILFIFIAAVAFLGFLLNVFFDKLKIMNVLPLMLIGLLVGPILNLINTGPTSTIAVLTPFITAIAVAFILFEVGLNINIFKLSKVIVKATKFTVIVAFLTGITLAVLAFFAFHWSIIEALIFGFALSGPSSVIVPTLMKLIGAPSELRTALVYEGVVTDSIQLIIPLLLFGLLTNSNITIGSITSLVAGVVFGSVLFGALLALILLYVLKKFMAYSRNYSWMLTVTMVIAIYGISQQLNFSGALTVFIFGILFSNIGNNRFKVYKAGSGDGYGELKKFFGDILERYFSISDVSYVSEYQREIVFFTSTFFFVYIGLLFDLSNLTLFLIGISILITVIIVIIRHIFSPMIREYIPRDKSGGRTMKRIISFDISRGLSSAIVATLPLAFGIVIPNFLDQVFLVILFTNLASTIGMFLLYSGVGNSKRLRVEH